MSMRMSKKTGHPSVLVAMGAAIVLVGAVPTTASAQAVGGTTWYGEVLVDVGTDGLPFTADDTRLPLHLQFHSDRTFTLSSVAEVGASTLLPGLYTTMQGAWRRGQSTTVELAGISLQTLGGETTTIRAVSRIRIDSPTRAAVTSVLVEVLPPCSNNLTCTDPTQGMPSVPPDAPFDLGTLRRLTLPD